MLMTREHETVEAGGLGHGGAFTIAASTKAFEVLSSNLYQNKTLAVIREITCNAVDAHTVAGLPIRDIKVHLPTFTEPYFAVRDYGPGMSESDVLSLYTTYFRSTKDQDNTQIGGFGLGSKSPFAVSDQFTVTSWHGGTKSTYVCYKQDGLPRVNITGSVPCGAETGIEVRVPHTSASGSVIVWQDEARRLFRWWADLPDMNVAILADDGLFTPENVALQSDRHLDDTPEWTIFKSGTHNTIIMGNVPYTLNEPALKDVPPVILTLLQKVRLAIRVPMGSVSISPSRETLSYDAATITYLVAKLKDVTRDIAATLERELAHAESLAEARRMVHSRDLGALSYLFIRLKDIVKPHWNGKPVPNQVFLDLKTAFSVPATAFDYVRKSHWTNFQRETYAPGDPFEHTFPKYEGYMRLVLWTEKVTSKTYATLRHNYKEGVRSIEARLHVFTGIPYQELVDKCLELGIPKPINIDTDLEAPPKEAIVSTRVPPTQHYPVTLDNWRHSYGMKKDSFNLAGGGLFVPFSEGKPILPGILHAYTQLVQLGVLPAQRVVGIPRLRLAKGGKLMKALAANGWQELTGFHIQATVDMPTLLRLEQDITVKTWRTNDLSELRHGIIMAGMQDAAAGKMWRGFDGLHAALVPHMIAFTVPIQWHNAVRSHSLDTIRTVLSDVQWSEVQKVLATGVALRQATDAFLGHHPLLAYVNGGGKPDLAVVREYVNR